MPGTDPPESQPKTSRYYHCTGISDPGKSDPIHWSDYVACDRRGDIKLLPARPRGDIAMDTGCRLWARAESNQVLQLGAAAVVDIWRTKAP